MNQVSIKSLDPQMLPLVQKLYKQHYKSAKAKSNELIYVAYFQSELCGVVRLRTINENRLLTGMLVSPNRRGMGIGHLILQHCRSETLSVDDYCFAYHNLQPLYQQHGFIAVEPSELPISLKQLFDRYSQSGKNLTPMRFSI